MHLDILAAQDPVEGHIMGRRVPGYRPAQHPVPDQTIEQRVGGQGLSREPRRGEKQENGQTGDLLHGYLVTVGRLPTHTESRPELLASILQAFSPGPPSKAPSAPTPSATYRVVQRFLRLLEGLYWEGACGSAHRGFPFSS